MAANLQQTNKESLQQRPEDPKLNRNCQEISEFYTKQIENLTQCTNTMRQLIDECSQIAFKCTDYLAETKIAIKNAEKHRWLIETKDNEPKDQNHQ